MKHPQIILTFVFISFLCSVSHAQLFDRLKKKTMEKLEQKAEDKLVEELSEEIAKRAFRPIEKAMDDMLRSSFEEENGGEIDWEKAGESYAAYLNGMNEAANVPASYSFDLILDIEIKDGEKNKHQMQYYLSTTTAIMGIKQRSEEENLIVLDAENDLAIIYSEEDGEKNAQALPSIMKMAGMFAGKEEKHGEVKVEKTGKTKKIAGYDCEEWKIESEKEKIKAFISPDFPVNMKATFAKMWGNFMPENYKKSVESIEGMMLKSEYKSKEKKEYNSNWEVKKVKKVDTTIINAEYGLKDKSNE